MGWGGEAAPLMGESLHPQNSTLKFCKTKPKKRITIRQSAAGLHRISGEGQAAAPCTLARIPQVSTRPLSLLCK